MPALNKHMLREYWSRQQAGTKLKFGFDDGVLLQCDFLIAIFKGGEKILTSDTWVMDAVSVTPSQLSWTNDAELFGAPIPQLANTVSSITFLSRSENTIGYYDSSIGDILKNLYEAQFDPDTGVLALPSAANRITFGFSLMGTMTPATTTLAGTMMGDNAADSLVIRDDQLRAFPLFELIDVKLGAPEVAVDPKSMNPMGVKLSFAYRNTRWRDFTKLTLLANHDSSDDAIHTVKLGESRNNNTNNPNK